MVLLIKLENDWFDLTTMHHPGGDMINLFHMKDGTVAYKSIHGRNTLSPHLKKRIISFENKENDVLENRNRFEYYESKQKPNYKFDSDLAKEIRVLNFKDSQVAPLSWWIRFFFITIMFIYLEYEYRYNPSYIKSISLGTTYALIGLNIGHDASHGAVSKKPILNEQIAHYMDFIGNNSISWFKQHVVQHHGYTNENKHDPDTFGGAPLMFFDKENKKHDYGLYFTPVLSLLGFSYIFGFMRVLNVPKQYKMTAISWRLFLYFRLFSPLITGGFTYFRLLNLAFVILFSGGVLGILFVVSHNTTKTKRNPLKNSDDWYRNQIETSCTYGGKIAGYLTGGLNYQIEHHCFPRMNSMHYPKIHYKLKQLCKKYKVEYNYYDNFIVNFIDTMKWINV